MIVKTPSVDRMQRAKNEKAFPRLRTEGFTLFEVVIYMAILSVMSLAISLLVVQVSHAVEESTLYSTLLERNRKAFSMLNEDIRNSLAGTAAIGNAGKSVTFSVPGPFDAATTVPDTVIRYEIRTGVNQPGDVLVRTNLTANQETIQTAYLDRDRSNFELTARGCVSMTLTTLGRTKSGNADAVLTKTFVIFPQNGN